MIEEEKALPAGEQVVSPAVATTISRALFLWNLCRSGPTPVLHDKLSLTFTFADTKSLMRFHDAWPAPWE